MAPDLSLGVAKPDLDRFRRHVVECYQADLQRCHSIKLPTHAPELRFLTFNEFAFPPQPQESGNPTMTSRTPTDSRPDTVSKSGQQPEQSSNHYPSTCAEIDRLLERIELDVRQPVSVVFSALLELLRQVPQFENLGQEAPAPETRAALENFRDQANVLVDFMLATATKCANQHERLSETLDGISFAMSHDVKRIFDSELKALNWHAGEQLSIGKVAYIQGLLTNCLQQSLITLAQVFDSTLDGARLFDNNKVRLRESLVLCRDLMDMLQIVHTAETDLEQQSPILANRVHRFRHESMQFLMYRDWQEFEAITESLLISGDQSSEPGSPLHSFKCYLETLLGQVKLRAVLVDVFCDLLPEVEESNSEWSEAQNRLAFELYRAELSSMIERDDSQEVSEEHELV